MTLIFRSTATAGNGSLMLHQTIRLRNVRGESRFGIVTACREVGRVHGFTCCDRVDAQTARSAIPRWMLRRTGIPRLHICRTHLQHVVKQESRDRNVGDVGVVYSTRSAPPETCGSDGSVHENGVLVFSTCPHWDNAQISLLVRLTNPIPPHMEVPSYSTSGLTAGGAMQV